MMTKKEAEELWRSRPEVRAELEKHPRIRDITMLRESWNNYTDQLCRDKLISRYQYDYWEHPKECKK